MDSTIIKAIADELDGSERYVLAWIEREGSVIYREVSGESLDVLLVRGLVRMNAINQPRAMWPVSCTELGAVVGNYLRTDCKVISNKKA